MSNRNDETTTVAMLRDMVRRFAADREWEPYHTPKNLAMGAAIEAAELMEHFLWVDGPGSLELMKDPDRREQVADEIADVACHLFNLCNVVGLDLSEAFRAKMAKNDLKYPAEQYRGRYTK